VSTSARYGGRACRRPLLHTLSGGNLLPHHQNHKQEGQGRAHQLQDRALACTRPEPSSSQPRKTPISAAPKHATRWTPCVTVLIKSCSLNRRTGDLIMDVIT
jgi:hypothetical protein